MKTIAERIADKRIDHWGVGHFLRSGKFGGCAANAAHCLDKADAETIAARYEAKYGPTYRAVAFNRNGYIVTE